MGSATGTFCSLSWFTVDWLISEPAPLVDLHLGPPSPPFSSWKPIIIFFSLWVFDDIDSQLLPDMLLHIYGSYPISSVRYCFSRVKTAIFQKFSYKNESLGPSLRFLLLILLLIFCYLFAGNKLLHVSGKVAAGYASDPYRGQLSELGLWSCQYPMRQIDRQTCSVFRADFRISNWIKQRWYMNGYNPSLGSHKLKSRLFQYPVGKQTQRTMSQGCWSPVGDTLFSLAIFINISFCKKKEH